MYKNKILTIIIIIICLCLTACDNEIHLCDTWKEETIVYGILDPTDTMTNLRITKAFLGEGNAYNMAKIVDSSEYDPDDITVTMEEWQNGTRIKVFKFAPDYIHNKQGGTFYSPDQMVFSANTLNQLNVNSTYKIVIVNASKDTVMSTTSLVDTALRVTKPFSYTSALPTLYPNLNYPTVIDWTPVQNGVRYNLSANFYVVEVLKNGDSITRCIPRGSMNTCTIDLDDPPDYLECKDSPDAFLSFVKDNVKYSDSEKENNVAYRKVGTFVLIFAVAGEDFEKYINVQNSNSSLSQYQNTYTNVTNGLGLFSARAKKYYTCQISEQVKNVLYNNISYSDLKFSSRN